MPQLPVPTDVLSRLRAAGCVFAEDEARLLVEAARSAGELDTMVARRVAGIPLEQVLGWAGFCGLRIVVEPGVFVPRRRTEHLVHQAVAVAPPHAVVLDMCCGSGAVGVALLAALPGIDMHATDIDPVAVRCARRNVGDAGHVHEGDLFQPLPAALRGRVDLVVANAPYVPNEALAMMPSEARDHEHRVALDGGPDGVDVQRRVAAEVGGWLAPGGHLLVETSRQQAQSTVEAFTRNGLVPRVTTSDDLQGTVVVGRRA